MSLESLIDDAGTMATITIEAPEYGQVAQDALGGAIRTDPWSTIVSDIPCLVAPQGQQISAWPPRNDSRASINNVRIYFVIDPCPDGLSTRHRITVTSRGRGGPDVTGIYAVVGAQDPNSMSRILQVDCEKIRN